MNYTDCKGFMKIVKENDVFAIKSELEGLISLFKGEKEKCDQAIEYAIKNSSFNWEKDDGISSGINLNGARQNYIYEKGRLVQNFTMERYLKVLTLYTEYRREENQKKGNINSENIKTEKENYEKRKEEEKNKRSESKTESTTIKSIPTQRSGRNRNKVLDREDKTIFQRTALLGVAVVVVIWILIKMLF